MVTLDTGDLTGITAYDWREVGTTFTRSTEATFSPLGLGNRYFECAVTCDQGVVVSPPFQAYATSMMGEMMPAAHMSDDRAILSIIPQSEATHVAVADGSWTDSATWYEGKVPRNGAVVLIPHDITVTYDNSDTNIRLDRVRVDGSLIWALDRTTELCVETLVVTRGGAMVIGTSSGRVPAQYRHDIIISGKDYSARSFRPTDLKASNFLETRGWGRGVLVQGLCRIWGAEKTTWFKADPIDQGATSLRARGNVLGLSVGDEICIGGTDQSYTYVPNEEHAPVYQDEYRTVTAINGSDISWDAPLTHPHKNQLPGSTRTDLYPAIMVRRNKNVCITSEVKDDISRRGHFAVMHHWATLDVWDMEAFELGRTDKSIPAGIINDTGAFEFAPENNGGTTSTAALTPRSNLQGRYSLHAHLLGHMHMGDRPIMSNCVADGSPGWGIVDHNNDMDIDTCAAHNFFGCGIVAEAGSETGKWINNLVMHTSVVGNGGTNFANGPKNMSKALDEHGDLFRHGFGYGFRGRAVRQVGNVACSVTYGRSYSHREHANNAALVKPINPPRSSIDIQGQGYPKNPNYTFNDQFDFVDMPIVHSADEESIAVMAGTFVTKSQHLQNHDVNVRFKRHLAWGYQFYNASPEYVGVYILEDFDSVAGKNYQNVSSGIAFGANTHEVAFTRVRSEGNSEAILVRGQDTTGNHDDYVASTNPRWMIFGLDDVDNQQAREDTAVTDVSGNQSYTKTVQDVLLQDMDFGDTAIDLDATPTCSLPALMGSFNDWANRANNADGRKSDNVSTQGKVVFKSAGDGTFFSTNGSGGLTTYQNGAGHYDVVSADNTVDGKTCVVVAVMMSDRLTARPVKYTYFYDMAGAVSGTNNGTFNYSTTPVVQSDMKREVEHNGSVTIDVTAGATGGAGPGTYELDADTDKFGLNRDYLAPDHGELSFNGATGEITYTPDRNYVGSDEAYVFIKSQGQYATVRLDFLVGGDASRLDTPEIGTDLVVADHAADGTIAVQLLEPVNAGARRIRLVEYSTDAGSTWRRLCYGWVKAVHKVTVKSDGSAIGAGNHDIRLRYKTDYDYSTSADTGDVSVGVSGAAPVISSPGIISGTYQTGDLIAPLTPTASDFGIVFTYQWQRDGVDITGATNETYLVGPEDAGTSIRRQVTATNATGSDTDTSNAVTPTAFEEEAQLSTVFRDTNVTIANGTQASTSASANNAVHVDKAVLEGKVYFEVVVPAGAHVRSWVGLTRMNYEITPGNDNAQQKNDIRLCRMDGAMAGPDNFGTDIGPSVDRTNGDVFYCAYDVDNKLAWFGSESSGWVGNPAAGTGGFSLFDLEPMVIAICPRHGSASPFTLRSLSADFTGTVPSGFTPLAEIESSAVVSNTPAAADTILDKHGINMKLSFRAGQNGSFPPTPWPLSVYNWVPEMVMLGFRHIRTLVGKNNAAHADLKTLYDRTGIKVTSRLVSKTTIDGNFPSFPVADIDEILSKHETESGLEIVHAFEGGNEVDDGKNYAGWAQASVNSQEYMYDAIKAKPALANLPILGPSVWRRNETSINAMVVLGLYDFCDTAAPHIYAGNDRPTLSSLATGANVNNLTVQPTHLKRAIESAATIAPPGSEVWVTETGPENESNLFGQSLGDRSMVPTDVAAKYYLRDLMEMLRYGADMVFMYALFDNNLQSTKNTYGLLSWPDDQNAVRRPTFYSAMRFNSLIKDLVAFTPTPLRMTLTGNLSEVGHAVYQRSSGNYLLMIWQDCQTFNTNDVVTVTHPDRSIDLQLETQARVIRKYEPSIDGAVTTAGIDTDNVTLSVPDHVVVYEIAFNDTVAAPEYGLEPTALIQEGTVIDSTVKSGSDNAVFSADFTGLDGSSGGMIFKTGNASIGAYAGFSANGDFRVRCGRSDAALPYGECAYLIVPAALAPSGDGSLVVEFITGTNTLRAWWNGKLLGTAVDRATGTGWWTAGGSSDGAYLVTPTDEIPVGEIGTPVAYTTAGDLKYYENQVSVL
ncbi:MAG: G8 domain-containing protein [Paracoccaceae bacterium]